MEAVNYIIESQNRRYFEYVIKSVKPNYYVKGPDYKNLIQDKTKKIKLEKKAVEKYKGKIIFTKLYSEFFKVIESEMIFLTNKKFFKFCCKKINQIQIEKILKKIHNLKILVVGETIIDKYTFIETVGKASKDPMLVVKKKDEEIYLGGASSIVQNVKKLCKKVHFYQR